MDTKYKVYACLFIILSILLGFYILAQARGHKAFELGIFFLIILPLSIVIGFKLVSQIYIDENNRKNEKAKKLAQRNQKNIIKDHIREVSKQYQSGLLTLDEFEKEIENFYNKKDKYL